MKREEYIKLLRDNEDFKAALQRVSSPAERQAIKAYTEDFMMKFYNGVLRPIEEIKKADPEALKNAVLEVDGGLVTSGSAEAEKE
jgi:hypothetical protein